jgi:hypothetical protein
MQVSVRRLQDDVEQGLLLNETDPDEAARGYRWMSSIR